MKTPANTPLTKEQKCNICFDNASDPHYLTCCNHYFHSDCMREWLREKYTCPLCRHSLAYRMYSINIEISLEKVCSLLQSGETKSLKIFKKLGVIRNDMDIRAYRLLHTQMYYTDKTFDADEIV